MKKQYGVIYAVYILLGLSLGIWDIFKPIWLIEKGILIQNLGITFFVALLLAAMVSLVSGKKVMKFGIRKCIQIAITTRILIFLCMIFSNNSSIIILLSCFDLLIDTLVIQWMYPLLSQIKISNTFFGLKDNLYDLASNLGTILAGVLIGIILIKFTSYQICISICMLLFLICLGLLTKIENVKIELQEKGLTKEILQIEGIKEYIKYSCSRRFQLYLILGFFMVLLTKKLGIGESFAGIFWATIQIVCNILGIFVSFRSDKMNRVHFFQWSNISSIIVLILAIFSKGTLLPFIAIIWIDILSDFYSPIIDAPLTNEIPKELQLHFANVKHILSYIGRGLAYLVAGYCIQYNYKLIFLLSAILLVYQNYIGVKALRKCRRTNVLGI